MGQDMKANRLAVLAALLMCAGVAVGEMRTWSNASGKFKIEAELLSSKEGKVQLRSSKGREITVALNKLSDADLEFIKSLPAADKADPKKDDKAATIKQIRKIADLFYKDLRTKEREAARDALTEAARDWVKEGKSPLGELPSPDKPSSAIKVGKPVIDGTAATVPVQVRIGGKMQKTELQLRNDAEEWRVVAISATVGSDEKTISLEPPAPGAAPPAAPEPLADPLAALVGKPIEVSGVTPDGKPVSLNDFKGKVVLIDFWATWCGPCIAEIPNVRANWDKYHEAGFEVMAISVDGDLGALNAFVAQEKPPWTVLADAHPKNRVSMSGKFGIRGIPAFILVGKDGNVAAIHCRGPRLGEELSKLLGEPPAAAADAAQ